MSRNRLLLLGVEKARLYVMRKLWSGDGLKTSAARGERCESSSRL